MEEENQNNVEATTAEEEAQGHGSKEKQSKLEQGVSLDSSTVNLASKQAAENAGVEQGDGVDDVNPVNFPHPKFRYAKLGSPQEAMKGSMEDDPDLNKEDENEQLLQPSVSPSTPRVRPSSESAEVTGGTVEMEPGTNTLSNPSLGNAESSFKSKTAEWALLVTSVVLEATSAIFEQLGYALTSMVMAFVALLLSILDLILKARQRGITCDWCFYRQSNRNSRKPVASLVHYLGLAGALWQCSFTTVGYYYTHQKLVNPIKLCLLPFILALCVLISKVVKSSQHVPLDKRT